MFQRFQALRVANSAENKAKAEGAQSKEQQTADKGEGAEGGSSSTGASGEADGRAGEGGDQPGVSAWTANLTTFVKKGR